MSTFTRPPRPLLPRALRVAGATLLALLLAAGAWLLPGRSSGLEARGTSSEPAVEVLERAAISAHLERVERALRAAPVDHLDEGRREARVALLDELRAYREAGVFPRNVEVPGRAPVFVDDEGVHCAVGHLLHRTGEDAIVASIRESRNLALLSDLLDEPGLEGWLSAHGLEAREAAWIQPMYCNMQDDPHVGWLSWCPGPVNFIEDEVSTGYLLASLGTGWAGATFATVNLLDRSAGRPSTGRALIGMGAGAAGMGLGVAGILQGGETRSVGWANLALGAFGVATSTWTFRAVGSEVGGEPLRALTVRSWIPEVDERGIPTAVGVGVTLTR
jgi:hypothetical protein